MKSIETKYMDERDSLFRSLHNLDRRSFELNYENNILFQHAGLAAEVLERQADYIADSHQVTLEEVKGWSTWRRLWNNTIAMIGPVL